METLKYAVLFFVWSTAVTQARAAIVYEDIGIVIGSANIQHAYHVKEGGHYRAVFDDLSYGGNFSTLGMEVKTGGQTLATIASEGILEFDLQDDTTLFFFTEAVSRKTYSPNVYSLSLHMSPASPAIVPLPSAALLMASAIALLGFAQHARYTGVRLQSKCG
jgi:hypothetical protein